MLSKAYIDDCLKRKVIFFTGKGGVGKSTLTWASALACYARGARVVVARWIPFGAETASAVPVSYLPSVLLETQSAFKEYVLGLLKFEKVYDMVFDNQVLKTFILAAPGLSETVIAGKIWDLLDHGKYDTIFVDLPASGHAISFFESPLGIKRIFPAGFVHKNTNRIIEMFCSPTTRVDLVAIPEEFSLNETRELKQSLSVLHPMHFGYLHINLCAPMIEPPKVSPESSASTVLKWHRIHWERQEQFFREAASFAMPQERIERLPLDSWDEMIRVLAAETEMTS